MHVISQRLLYFLHRRLAASQSYDFYRTSFFWVNLLIVFHKLSSGGRLCIRGNEMLSGMTSFRNGRWLNLPWGFLSVAGGFFACLIIVRCSIRTFTFWVTYIAVVHLFIKLKFIPFRRARPLYGVSAIAYGSSQAPLQIVSFIHSFIFICYKHNYINWSASATSVAGTTRLKNTALTAALIKTKRTQRKTQNPDSL